MLSLYKDIHDMVIMIIPFRKLKGIFINPAKEILIRLLQDMFMNKHLSKGGSSLQQSKNIS